MAWRPTQYLLEGELDNTTPGKVTGWMRFVGMKDKVTFDLKGDFHRDIRGAKIHVVGDGLETDEQAACSMDGFSARQSGNVGDITAGLPPQDYVNYPYIEWYGDDNGRVVIELEAGQIQVIGEPMPWMESYPVSRQEQDQNMNNFLQQLAQDLNSSPTKPVCARTGVSSPPSSARTLQQLLPKAVRDLLPPLYSQDGKGGDAVAYVKFFTPDNSWTWWATEFNPDDGLFFGLVDGMAKELGYFSLSDLQTAVGPAGMHIERDIHWQPTRLRDIAPEMFAEGGDSNGST